MADFECQELEIGLEFEHNNVKEGSSEHTKYAQVILVR